MIADVAADGLTVQFARREPQAIRGTIQTTVYMVRTCGQVLSVSFVAFCMNGYAYKGTFAWSLHFNQVMGALAIPCAIMVPVSWLGIQEDRVVDEVSVYKYANEM